MKNNRDDFLAKTIKLLRDRVGDMCSNPDCHNQTKGASSVEEETANVGVAAHIYAASTTGKKAPRYNSMLSREQRRHYNNGIWLCETCAKLIDSDEKRFTATLLKQWKRAAEQRARDNIGKKLITESEKITSISDALTGNDLKSASLVTKDIINKIETKLSDLDKRLEVKVNILHGEEFIRAVSPEGLSPFKTEISQTESYKKQFSDFENYGKPITINTEDVHLLGSELLSEMVKMTGKELRIEQTPAKISVVIRTGVDANHIDYILINTKGDLFVGEKQISIYAKDLGGLLDAAIFMLMDGEKIIRFFKLGLCLESWENKDIQHLPYFSRLEKFALSINDDSLILIDMPDVYDSPLILKIKNNPEVNEFISKKIIPLALYLKDCRELVSRISRNIKFNISKLKSTPEESRDLKQAVILLNEPILIPANAINNPIVERLIFNNAEAINKFKKESKSDIKLIEDRPWFVSIMGEQIALPPRVFEFINSSIDIKEIENSNDDKLEVEIRITVHENGFVKKSLTYNP